MSSIQEPAALPGGLVLESVQKVQRGLEIRNIRNGTDEEQQRSENIGHENQDFRPSHKHRDSRVVPIRNLGAPLPPLRLTRDQPPPQSFEFHQAQNVLSTASTPVGISHSRADLVSASSNDSYSRRNSRNVNANREREGRFTFSVRKILIIIQIIFILLYAIFVSYGDEVMAKSRFEAKRDSRRDVLIVETTTMLPVEETIAYHASDYSRLQKYYSCKSEGEKLYKICFRKDFTMGV